MRRDPDEFVRNVRKTVLQWKQKQLLSSLQDEQDTMKLNEYIKLTALTHEMLKKYIKSDGKSPVDPILSDIVQSIGSPSSLTPEEEMLIEDSLFRDLVEYPFTYNTALINSFDKRNVLNTNIVPNK